LLRSSGTRLRKTEWKALGTFYEKKIKKLKSNGEKKNPQGRGLGRGQGEDGKLGEMAPEV